MKGEMLPVPQLIKVEKRKFVIFGKPEVSYKVTPGRVTLRRGDNVQIVYEGVKGGMVLFPLAEVFGRQTYKLPLGKGSQVKLKVRNNAPFGTFSYAVIVHEKDGDYYAEGSSPPKMTITDPKRGGRET